MAKIEEYKPGMIVYGKISGIKPYGAFVSFEDGVSGLVHISEISSSYVRNIDQYFKINSYIMTKVIDVDLENKQLRLSYKALHNKRKTPDIKFVGMPKNILGFSSIAKKMPEWLKNHH